MAEMRRPLVLAAFQILLISGDLSSRPLARPILPCMIIPPACKFPWRCSLMKFRYLRNEKSGSELIFVRRAMGAKTLIEGFLRLFPRSFSSEEHSRVMWREGFLFAGIVCGQLLMIKFLYISSIFLEFILFFMKLLLSFAKIHFVLI